MSPKHIQHVQYEIYIFIQQLLIYVHFQSYMEEFTMQDINFESNISVNLIKGFVVHINCP